MDPPPQIAPLSATMRHVGDTGRDGIDSLVITFRCPLYSFDCRGLKDTHVVEDPLDAMTALVHRQPLGSPG